MPRKRLISNGAPSRSRTGTSFRTTDFKSGVSTNFTIRAVVQISRRTSERCREGKLTRAGNIYIPSRRGKFKGHGFQSVRSGQCGFPASARKIPSLAKIQFWHRIMHPPPFERSFHASIILRHLSHDIRHR